MNERGFSKVELFFVALLGAVLLFMFMPRFFSSADKSKYSAHQQQRRLINEKLETFYFKFGFYPEAMTKKAWRPPDGSSLKQFFEGKFPTKCNYGAHWTIIGGRVDLSAHAAHEGEIVISSDDHVQERLFINTMLKRYREDNGFYPESMTNGGWIGVNGESYTRYFPKGVPSDCANGIPWEIDTEEGIVSELHHENHEK